MTNNNLELTTKHTIKFSQSSLVSAVNNTRFSGARQYGENGNDSNSIDGKHLSFN